MTARKHNRTLPGRVTILAALGAASLALIAATPANAIYRSYEMTDSEPPVMERTASSDDGTMGGGNMGCNVKLGDGTIVVYPHGSTMTVDLGDGSTPDKYVCNNGKWEKVAFDSGDAGPHYEADEAYVDADAMLVLVNPHAEYTYTSENGFYAEP